MLGVTKQAWDGFKDDSIENALGHLRLLACRHIMTCWFESANFSSLWAGFDFVTVRKNSLSDLAKVDETLKDMLTMCVVLNTMSFNANATGMKLLKCSSASTQQQWTVSRNEAQLVLLQHIVIQAKPVWRAWAKLHMLSNWGLFGQANSSNAIYMCLHQLMKAWSYMTDLGLSSL